MHALPRSRTLSMLRTPAPYRLLAAALGWVGLCAAAIQAIPALSDRARLGGALLDATATRLDPMLEQAQTGRWPTPGPIASPSNTRDPSEALVRRVTESGIVITQVRTQDRIDLALSYTRSPGDIVAWRCEVRASDEGVTVSPLSVPAECRP